MEVGFLALDGLEEELVDQDGLEGDSINLDDAVDYMDTSRDGMIGVEETDGDGEAAVDEDKEDSEIQKKKIDCVFKRCSSFSEFLDPEESNTGCQESEKVDGRVENFAQIFVGRVLLRVLHSHWSRSLEMLCSDWLNLTMLAPRSMP